MTGQEMKVDVPVENETESATELREGKAEWVGIDTQIWVRRDAVVKIEIRGESRGF